MGPLVTKQHRDKVESYIDIGEKEGAKLVVDGRGFRMQGYENGFFGRNPVRPCHARDADLQGRDLRARARGDPRARITPRPREMINEHEFGNGTAIFTRDGDAAREFAHNIQVGMVGINVPIPVPMAFHSFGGWKASLFGDHHMHGPEGVRFYTKLKTITSRWPTGIRAGADFVMPTMR